MYMLRNLHNHAKRARGESLTMPGRAYKMFEEHKDIYEAIKTHDKVMAEKAYIRHIRNTVSNLKKAMVIQEK